MGKVLKKKKGVYYIFRNANDDCIQFFLLFLFRKLEESNCFLDFTGSSIQVKF